MKIYLSKTFVSGQCHPRLHETSHSTVNPPAISPRTHNPGSVSPLTRLESYGMHIRLNSVCWERNRKKRFKINLLIFVLVILKCCYHIKTSFEAGFYAGNRNEQIRKIIMKIILSLNLARPPKHTNFENCSWHATEVWSGSVVCSGSVVVTAYDFESGRPGSNPEWGLIYYEASITAHGLPEPSSLRGNTLGTRTAEHKGCNWGTQVDWWLQPRAVFGHTFIGIIWYMPRK